MLTEERQQLILKHLYKKGTITVTELVERLGASESTIRRDLVALDEKGRLKKIHGGAMVQEAMHAQVEYRMERKKEMNLEAKEAIAKMAATFIKDGDVIYIDAGTTTELMIGYITAKDLKVVTNGIGHVTKLLQKGIPTLILGGQVKALTEAVVGAKTVTDLNQYHFTKGFFGTNGVSVQNGYTTPDVEEALVKQKALEKSQRAFVLADESKLHNVSFVSFAAIDEATLITNGKVTDTLGEQTKIVEVEDND